VYLLAFSVAATKLPNYILPAMPPLALLIARFFDRWRQGELDLPAWIQPTSLAIVATVGIATTGGLLLASGTIDLPLLRGQTSPALQKWAALGLVPIISAALGAWCLIKGQRGTFVTVMVLGAVGFIAPLAAGGATALDCLRAPRPLVEQAGACQRDREIRVGCYHLDYLPSLNFYVQRQVRHHHSELEVRDFLAQALPAFLFLPESEWEALAPRLTMPYRVLAKHQEMYRGRQVVVVTNH
jgi:hypothetical protein